MVAEVGELLLANTGRFERPLSDGETAAVHAEIARAYWDAKLPDELSGALKTVEGLL